MKEFGFEDGKCFAYLSHKLTKLNMKSLKVDILDRPQIR